MLFFCAPSNIKHSCFILTPAQQTHQRSGRGIETHTWKWPSLPIPGVYWQEWRSIFTNQVLTLWLLTVTDKQSLDENTLGGLAHLVFLVFFLNKGGAVQKIIRAAFYSSDLFLRILSALTLTTTCITPSAAWLPTARNRSAENSAAVSSRKRMLDICCLVAL